MFHCDINVVKVVTVLDMKASLSWLEAIILMTVAVFGVIETFWEILDKFV